MEEKIVHISQSTTSGFLKIRSEEVQEILSVVPHWILRWGITSLFVVILFLFAVSWMVKYPDRVTSTITMTMPNPAVNLIARSSGKLAKIFVTDKEWVCAQTLVAAIDNPTNLDDYMELKQSLERFESFVTRSEGNLDFRFKKLLDLGELQTPYSVFIESYEGYSAFVRFHYYPRKITSIESQIGVLQSMSERLIRQKELLQKELELAEKNLTTARSLFDKKIASEIELSSYESTFLQKKYALESSETQISNTRLLILEHENTILDINQQYADRERQLILSIQESFKQLQSAMAIWEQKYILRAPIDGRVSFFKFWSENQFIQANDEMMSIIPSSLEIIGKVDLSGLGSGKVQPGQTVRVRFESYPVQEFGMVTGEVISVSQVSKESRYLATVRLPKGLITNFGKNLEFKEGMIGSAEITTEDLRMIERIFYQLRYAFVNAAE